MNYGKIINFDSGNATGLSVVLFVSGCTNQCEGCHNKETWNFNYGKLFTDEVKEDLIQKIQNPHIRNFVVSGGDPLHPKNIEQVFKLVKEVKEITNKKIILYTGYSLAALQNNEVFKQMIYYIDILIDGKFDINNVSPLLDFRGSLNQRAWSFNKGEAKDISEEYFRYNEEKSQE